MTEEISILFLSHPLKTLIQQSYQDVLKYFAELRTDCKIHVWEKARTRCVLPLNEDLNRE